MPKEVEISAKSTSGEKRGEGNVCFGYTGANA